jgi:hypothetical protein
MAVSDIQIGTEDLISLLPIPRSGIAPQPVTQAAVRYIISEAVTGIDFTLDDEIIDLSTLEDATVQFIRMKLWVFRNGQKLIYDIGFTIDFDNNKIVPEYEPDDEVFETYLYP